MASVSIASTVGADALTAAFSGTAALPFVNFAVSFADEMGWRGIGEGPMGWDGTGRV